MTTDEEFGEFFVAHGQALLRFAFLLTGGRSADAEDLVQSVLARLVARGLDGLDDPAAYARRSIVNEYHSAGRRASVELRAQPRLAADRPDDDARSRREDRLAALGALGTLPERQRMAIVLRYYEDLPDTEIAELLACSRVTVRSLIHRALPRLRAGLGAAYGAATESARTGGGDD